MFVAVVASLGDDGSRVRQIAEDVLVQAFVPKPRGQRFHIRVLRWPAIVDRFQLHAALLGPPLQCAAGELRALIRPNDLQQPPEAHRAFEDLRDIRTLDAAADGEVDRFLGDVVHAVQTLSARASPTRSRMKSID